MAAVAVSMPAAVSTAAVSLAPTLAELAGSTAAVPLAPTLAGLAGSTAATSVHFAVEDFPAAAFTSTQRRAREWVEFMTTGFVMDRLAAA
jgi:hypothetical protein